MRFLLVAGLAIGILFCCPLVALSQTLPPEEHPSLLFNVADELRDRRTHTYEWRLHGNGGGSSGGSYQRNGNLARWSRPGAELLAFLVGGGALPSVSAIPCTRSNISKSGHTPCYEPSRRGTMLNF